MIHAFRRSAWAGLVLALLCFALPALAKEPDYPKLTGRVVDQAGILSDEVEGQLTGWLQGFEQDTKRQVVVATIKSLDGEAIEEYGVGLGRKWGIGQKGTDSGAILLVAPNDPPPLENPPPPLENPPPLPQPPPQPLDAAPQRPRRPRRPNIIRRTMNRKNPPK